MRVYQTLTARPFADNPEETVREFKDMIMVDELLDYLKKKLEGQPRDYIEVKSVYENIIKDLERLI